ncbi:MAG: hypothetical protein ABIH42_03690 [Planctomycetota bacterium]
MKMKEIKALGRCRMKKRIMGLVLGAVVLASGCAHIATEVKNTPDNVIYSLEYAVKVFENGDIAFARDLIEDALKTIPKQNYKMRRQALIGLAYVNMFMDNLDEVVKISGELKKVSSKLDSRKISRDPQEAIIHVLASIKNGREGKARAILAKNEKLRWTSMKSFMLEEEK